MRRRSPSWSFTFLDGILRSPGVCHLSVTPYTTRGIGSVRLHDEPGMAMHIMEKLTKAGGDVRDIGRTKRVKVLLVLPKASGGK